jgi:ABC-type sugar transport system permease subunit
MTVSPTTFSAPTASASWTRRFSVRGLAFGATLAVVSYLVLVPLIMLLFASVKSTEDKLPFEATGTTLANYITVLTNPGTVPIFVNTFLFTLGSLLIGLPLAVLMAWLLERTAIPARRWIATLILVPMTIPSLLSAIAWIQLLDPRIGLINVVLRAMLGLSGDSGPFDIYSLYGMCFVQGLRLVPSAYLMIAASFRAMDPSLEEQSAMAGRGVGQTTLRITLPIMRPALLAMLIYYIIVVIESFDIPGLLGFTARIRVLSTAIYWATHSEVGLPDYGLASALGALVLAVALLLMWGYQRLTAHQERFATITGKGYRPRQINLGAWTWPATALCGFYILMAVILPFLMLIWTSVQPFYAVPSADSLARVTLEGYSKIWQEGTVSLGLWNTTVRGDDRACAAGELVRGSARQSSRRLVSLSRHRIFFAAMRAEHCHWPRVYFCLRAFSDSDLRHALDHRAGDDDALSRVQLTHHDFGADAGARRARRSIANVAGALGAHAAQNHHAATGAGHDQCVFLGSGARNAGAVDGAYALQSQDCRRLDNHLEHVAKRPNHGCGGSGCNIDHALRGFAARRPTLRAPAAGFRRAVIVLVSVFEIRARSRTTNTNQSIQ